VESLAELQERRERECRLTPDRALVSIADAEAFLQDRGLLTRTADSALPSLYRACHEPPYKPGSPGFATWPATKWPWFGELAERGQLVVAVHNGKNLMVTDKVAGLLGPICRAETERLRSADQRSARLLDQLARAGPSTIEDLVTELGLSRRELKQLRTPLQRSGALVSRSIQVTTVDGRHAHSSELARWDQVCPASSQTAIDPQRALGDLVVAGVRAAVLAPEAELRTWFSWPRYWTSALVDDLVREQRLRRIGDHVATAPAGQ
jgi:hypothetical protein